VRAGTLAGKSVSARFDVCDPVVLGANRCSSFRPRSARGLGDCQLSVSHWKTDPIVGQASRLVGTPGGMSITNRLPCNTRLLCAVNKAHSRAHRRLRGRERDKKKTRFGVSYCLTRPHVVASGSSTRGVLHASSVVHAIPPLDTRPVLGRHCRCWAPNMGMYVTRENKSQPVLHDARQPEKVLPHASWLVTILACEFPNTLLV
jgi:hypothetical protein